MSEESQIDSDTLKAYRETEFRVAGDTPMTLRVGQTCGSLARLQLAHRVDCSAFITACNPFSIELSHAENAARQAALAEDLRKRSRTFIDGVGQHPSNKWPGELSYLVLGLSLEAAKTLGRQLEQNAIVWSGADASPRLVLLR